MPGIRPQIGDILEVRTVCQCFDTTQISVNVMHYRMTSQGSSAPDLDEIAASFSNHFNAGYQLIMPASCTYRGTGVKNLTLPATEEHVSKASSGPGLASGTELPQQVSYVINFKTGLAGKGHRGRIYPGFVPTSHVNSSGNMSAAGITAIQLAASNIPITWTAGSGGVTGTYVLIVLRRQANKLPLPFPTWDNVNLVTARLQFGTQRRRGDFGRQNAVPLGF